MSDGHCPVLVKLWVVSYFCVKIDIEYNNGNKTSHVNRHSDKINCIISKEVFKVEERALVAVEVHTMSGIKVYKWRLPEDMKLEEVCKLIRNVKPSYTAVTAALDKIGAKIDGRRIKREHLSFDKGYTFIFHDGQWYVHHSDMGANRVVSYRDILDKQYDREVFYARI